MMPRVLFLLLIGFLYPLSSSGAQAQSAPKADGKGYRIELNVRGLPNDTLYLGFYYKGRTYIGDTSYRQSKALPFVFEGESAFPPGFFFAINPQNKLLFEFVLGKNQDLALRTEHPDYVANMKVLSGEENKLFFNFLQTNQKNYARAEPYLRVLRDSTSSSSDSQKAEAQIEVINAKAQAFVDRLVATHPNAIVSKLVHLQKKIDVPEAPTIGGSMDSTFQFHYYRQHFFDGFDLGDPIALRFSKNYFKEKVEAYLDHLHVPEVDTIIKAIDRMAADAKKEKENLQYLVWLCTLKYQRYPIMGMDSVFVYLYDRYYATGRMNDFAGAALVNSVKRLSDELRLSLIGKKAPNMIMLDQQGIPRSLYSLRNEYILLYFFDPDCGSCEKETPLLRKAIQQTAYDIGGFAVCADTSMQKMRDYIKKMDLDDWVVVNAPRTYTGNYQKQYDARSTPTTYILDKDFTIIAKRLPADKIDLFLRGYKRRRAVPSKRR